MHHRYRSIPLRQLVLVALGCLLVAGLGYAQTPLITSSPDLTVGEATSGTLTESDPQNINNGARYDLYGLSAAAGTVVNLQLESDFTAVLSLFSPDGDFVASAGSGSFGAETLSLGQTLEEGGRYVVAVNGGSAFDLGDYELVAERVEVVNSGTLTVPTEVTGLLGSESNSYTLDISETQRLVIDMTSDAFDTYLELYRDDILSAENDDGPTSTDAQLTVDVEPGSYELVATSFFDGNGLYTLSIAETAPLTVSGALMVPAEVSGEITADDAVVDARPSDLYTLTVDATTLVQIDLQSDTFDSFLTLQDSSETVISTDDDGGNGRNSQIQAELAPGSYRIVAASLFSDGRGAYTLSVNPADSVDPVDNVDPADNVDPVDNVDPAEPVELVADAELTLPAQVTGELMSDDAMREGSFVDLYTLSIDEAVPVRIVLGTDTFDPYLVLENEDGTFVAESDGFESAQLREELAPGNYRILVSSFFEATGPYELSAETFEPVELVSEAELTVPAEIMGELNDDDAVQDDSYVDLYTLSIDETTTVQIDLSSAAFDAFLTLETADGTFVAENDDGPFGVDSQLREELEPGSYRILTSSLFDFGTGAYTLSVAPFEAVELVSDGELTPPVTVSGELSEGDAMRDQSFVDLYTLTTEEATTVVIEMTSDPLDPYLYLETADGTPIAENDDGPGGTDSLLRQELTPGSYRILASSFFGGTGPYTLSVLTDETSGTEPIEPITPPEGDTISLTVQSLPSGAEVSVEGEPIGATPLFNVRIARGEQQTLRLDLPGYETFEMPVDLVFDRSFNIRLTPTE